MSHRTTGAKDLSVDADHFITAEFSPRQLQEAYGTIYALKMKLEVGARELGQLCQASISPVSAAVQNANEFLIDTAIRDRARRCFILPTDLFGEPAWDMMLELYRAQIRQYRVSVSDLCVASQGPTTTALRWISTLESKGLAARDADRYDGRRYYMRLTEDGSMAMTAYFAGRPAPNLALPLGG